jgi:WD40 repeat protein
MAVAAATRIGPYEVVSALGAGGMGEVYRARDTRLGRDVALKLLPERFASSPGRLERLRREARILASLNHPHIATLYGLEERDGTPVLVMELVEGETLSERLRRGPLGLPEALDCALQIAEALEAAHEMGILHRDLKPANVRLTSKGQVKLLDFGLAKAFEDPGPHGESLEYPSALPTEEVPATDSRGVSGTAPYMSPEQVRSEDLDRRTDVWALGCVLFEMLSGRRAFAGATSADALVAVLEKDPPWPALPANAPPAIRRLLERCLQKDKDKRLRDLGHARVEIEELLQGWKRGGRLAVAERSPYPGLRFFTEEEAGRFFGRENEVEALWGKLKARKLLAVIGPSGAGKTSFVRAGVVASRPQGWGGLVCTPGARPFAALAQALAPHLAGDADAVADLLRFEEADRALAAIARWRAAHFGALLVVDQFEELFTLNPPRIQARFAELLGRIASEGEVHVLLSLRDDFLIQCQEHPSLAAVFLDLTPLVPLRGEALRRALVEPAKREGYRFEDKSFVDEMLGFVAEERGALPLLAFAAARLWEERDTEQALLTRAAYERIGGVAGALAQHAEATLEAIGAGREPLVREVFRNLVTSEGTRAVIERDELLSVFADGRDEAGRVLDTLVDARLLTEHEAALDGASAKATDQAADTVSSGPARHRYVEIVHESLLEAWPRLVRWRTQDADGAQLRDHLRKAAHLWHEKGRSADLLWTGTAEREFEIWRERYPGALSAIEDDYARAMIGRARQRRLLRRFAAVAAIVVLAATVVAIGLSRQQAVEQAELARASRLVALGRLELDRYPSAALAYARASLEVADNREARLLALEALWHGPPARVLPETSAVVPVRAAFSPDGRRLALSGFGGTVAVWSEEGRALQRLSGNPVVADPRGVTFDPSGERLLTFAVRDPSVRAIDRSGRVVATIPVEAQWVRFDASGRLISFGASPQGPHERLLSVVEAHGREPRAISRWKPEWSIGTDHAGTRVPTSIDPSLGWLAYGRDRRVFLHPLNAPDSQRDVELGRHAATVREVLFHPDGELLFSMDDAGEIRIWSRSGRRLVSFVQGMPLHRYSLLSLDPGGARIAWFSGSERVACVLELRGPRSAAFRQLRRSDVTDGGSVVFHPSGDWVASTSYNGTALWPVGLPGSRVVFVHRDGPIRDLAFSPDSRVLASAARDGLYLVPLTADGGPVRRVELGAEHFAYGVAWAPSGRELALNAPLLGVYLVPVAAGAPRKILDYPSPKVALGHLAFDAAGRRLAVVSYYSPEASGKSAYIIDMTSGSAQTLPLSPAGSGGGFEGQTRAVGFAPDGQLVTAGAGGIRRWDLATGVATTLFGGPGKFATFAMTADGRIVVAVTGRDFDDMVTIRDSEVRLLDLETGAQRVIRSHGDRLSIAVATDPAGELVVTGDSAGVVRVGSTRGGEPHILLGHSGAVYSVAISPDRRWIASASGAEVRLWPVPDLAKPPLHTLPLDEILAKLRALTNLAVVEDPASPSGYRVAIGPFPGWKDVPTW